MCYISPADSILHVLSTADSIFCMFYLLLIVLFYVLSTADSILYVLSTADSVLYVLSTADRILCVLFLCYLLLIAACFKIFGKQISLNLQIWSLFKPIHHPR